MNFKQQLVKKHKLKWPIINSKYRQPSILAQLLTWSFAIYFTICQVFQIFSLKHIPNTINLLQHFLILFRSAAYVSLLIFLYHTSLILNLEVSIVVIKKHVDKIFYGIYNKCKEINTNKTWLSKLYIHKYVLCFSTWHSTFFLIKPFTILFVTSIFLILKKVLLRFTPCASKAKVRTPCPKQKPRGITHCHTRSFKIVCYKCSKISLALVILYIL